MRLNVHQVCVYNLKSYQLNLKSRSMILTLFHSLYFFVVQFEMGFKLNNGNSGQLWLNEWVECYSWEIQSSFSLSISIAGYPPTPAYMCVPTWHFIVECLFGRLKDYFHSLSLWLIEFRINRQRKRERTDKNEAT